MSTLSLSLCIDTPLRCSQGPSGPLPGSWAARDRANVAYKEAHDAHQTAQRRAIRYVDHFTAHGATMHDFASALGGAFRSPAFRLYALRAQEEREAFAEAMAAEHRRDAVWSMIPRWHR